jgi:hypothetical protein
MFGSMFVFGYMRYSCDNSSPVSIIDQMVNCLDKARQEDRFIPWAYVFCDYSVSGLDASRRGACVGDGREQPPRCFSTGAGMEPNFAGIRWEFLNCSFPYTESIVQENYFATFICPNGHLLHVQTRKLYLRAW